MTEHKALTAKDWEKIWNEIEDKEYFAVESKFQDDMCKRHGPGHYYIDAEEHWKRMEIFIQRTVNRHVKRKNPKREWVGLDEVEVIGMTCECVNDGTFNMDCAHDFARAIEAKLKEKNGG